MTNRSGPWCIELATQKSIQHSSTDLVKYYRSSKAQKFSSQLKYSSNLKKER
jgi:hypothetical protein